jgi:hypothetical protein
LSGYTPTLEHIKTAYVGKHSSLYTPQDRERAEEFDRWYRGLRTVSEHDAYYLTLLRQSWPGDASKWLKRRIFKGARLVYLCLEGLTK